MNHALIKAVAIHMWDSGNGTVDTKVLISTDAKEFHDLRTIEAQAVTKWLGGRWDNKQNPMLVNATRILRRALAQEILSHLPQALQIAILADEGGRGCREE